MLTLIIAASSGCSENRHYLTDAWAHSEINGGYHVRSTQDATENQFEVTRTEVSAGAREAGIGGGVVTIEAVRSASPQSLLGLDGNSLVLRVKHAFAFADPVLGPGQFKVAAGLIPDVWIDGLEDGYRLRSARHSLSLDSKFFMTSDLGARVGYAAFENMVELNLQFANGEGANQLEMNEGKNLTAVLTVRPLTLEVAEENMILAVHGVVRDGSLGPARARNHRFGGAWTLTHPLFQAGTEVVFADGFESRSERTPWIAGGWAEGLVFQDILGVWAALDYVALNPDADDANFLTWRVGVFADVVSPRIFTWQSTEAQRGLQRLRVGVNYQQTQFGDAGGAALGSPEISDSKHLMATFDMAGLLF
jgi:hypothetical protein